MRREMEAVEGKRAKKMPRRDEHSFDDVEKRSGLVEWGK